MSRRSTCFAALLCAASIGSAFAHAHLKTETPARDTVVTTPPTELQLNFSEGLEPQFTGITMTDASGKRIATGPGSLAAGSDTTLLTSVTSALAPGVYTVTWHALAKDGHKTNGTYSFTVQPG
jgi:methionine-rich copper-binding protein CopC